VLLSFGSTMKVLFLVLVGIAIVAAEDSCPAYGDWLPWSNSCMWMAGDDGKVSLKPMRQAFVDACAIPMDISALSDPPYPDSLKFPSRCGYCSSKVRCQKRPMSEGCFSLNFEHQVCEDFKDVCDMPMVPMMNNCRWNLAMEMVKQCMNRPEMPDWKREGLKKFLKASPETNCVEKDGRCKCCCHPYQPNEDATACEKVQDPPQCLEYGPYNDWSQCLWYPMEDMRKKFQEHCALEAPTDITPPPSASPIPDGMTIPEKCGFCSFKVRCKKRDAQNKPACFPVKADKKVCGPEDCPTCGNVCSMGLLPENDKMKKADGTADRCYYPQMLMQRVESQAKPVIGQIKNYWRKRGMLHLLKNIPLGKCVEKADGCKCCCHPYEPNEAGTECVLKAYCKTPEDLGIKMNTNA